MLTDLNKIPVLYISLSMFVSGFAVYSFFKFLYFYIDTRRKEIIHLIFFGLSASLYTTCDASSIIYYIFTLDHETARIFINIKELSPLLLIVSLPYMAEKILVLDDKLLRFNRFLFYLSVISSAVISVIALSDNKIFIGYFTPSVSGNFHTITVISDLKPLLIIKNILLTFYIMYSLWIFLLSKINDRTLYPVTKIIISFSVLAYVIFSCFFLMIFFRNSQSSFLWYFPYVNTGIAVFLAFNSFALIDNLINFSTKLIKIERELKSIIYQDRDTGITNRNGFINDLQMGILNRGALSMIFIDVDDFQNINESFGEKAGNEILKLLTARFLDFFASEGKLYRIGGDDFVFVHNNVLTDEEAINLSNKIISSLRTPFTVFGVPYTITVSIGIIHVPRDGKDPDTVLSNAYSAIRNAKQTKNTFKTFSKELSDRSTRKIEIVNLLRSSIDMDQFTMLYQPVVDKEEKLVYAESLLRCTNPDHGIGGPGNFIPLMQKAGLMKDIDDMVIRKTFHDMEMHIRKKIGVSINLSPGQLIDPSYSEFLSNFAAQHGIDTKMIILEIIENTLIENLSAGRESILNLKNKGFKIAIDDFGKGFSSLSYLSELPVDIIKLDMAFVESIPGDSKKEAIAEKIMELAHSLGLKIVAEGFEKSEQFEFFKKIGCDNFQGFYFSYPLPLNELMKKYLL